MLEQIFASGIVGVNTKPKIARAEDDRSVEPNRVRKSIGAETSFAKDLSNRDEMLQELEQIAQIVEQRLEEHETQGRTLTLSSQVI